MLDLSITRKRITQKADGEERQTTTFNEGANISVWRGSMAAASLECLPQRP
jgi:hypothetical protein